MQVNFQENVLGVIFDKSLGGRKMFDGSETLWDSPGGSSLSIQSGCDVTVAVQLLGRNHMQVNFCKIVPLCNV